MSPNYDRVAVVLPDDTSPIQEIVRLMITSRLLSGVQPFPRKEWFAPSRSSTVALGNGRM